jgi:Bacterial membrane protein YfhO
MVDRSRPTAFIREHRWPAAAILCGLALLVLYTLRGMLTAGENQLPGRDSVNLFIWEIYTRSVLATGTLPFWNPFHFAGTPHLADPQTTVLYPPAILLRWLPPETFLTWMAALHIWLAGAGVLFLCRVIGLGWMSSTAVSVAGMLGGAAGARLHNGHLLLLYCSTWLPWSLAVAIVSLRRATVWPHPALVLVLVLQFLAGYIQGSVYLVGALCLYYLYSAIWPEPGQPSSRRRALIQFVVLGVVSLGAAAFQLLPTAQLVVEAGRRSGIPYEDAIEGGWSFRSLVTFFFPFFGVSAETPHRDLAEAVAYVGWVLMALVPLALFDDRRRRIAIFFSVLAAVAVATVCVDLPAYRVHHAILPGFRYPGRVLFLATLSLAVLGGLGLERFIALSRARRWGVLAMGLAPSVAVIVASTLVVLPGDAIELRPPTPWWPWLPVMALAGLLVVGVLAGRAWHVTALTMALALVTVDISAFTAGAERLVTVEPIERVRQWMGPVMPGRGISTCEHRISSGEMLRNGQAGLDGLAGIILADYTDWAHVTASGDPLPRDGQFHGIDSEGPLPARRDLVDAANVSVIYSCAPLDAPSLTLISRVEEIYVYRNEWARPRAFWTCDGLVMTKGEATAQILASRFDHEGRLGPRTYVNVRWAPDVVADRRRSLENHHSLQDGVALDGRTWRYALGDSSVASVMALIQDPAIEDTQGIDRGTGRVVQPLAPSRDDSDVADRQLVTGTRPCAASGTVDVTTQNRLDGRLDAVVHATVPGYVFLSEPYYPERRAFIDDQPVAALKANLAFTAIPVPAGTHRLELRYVPTSFRLGVGISVLTLLVWAGASWRRRRG